MDTMVPINEQLLREVEVVAAKTGRTVPAVVEEALRDGLDRQKQAPSREPFIWPTLDLGPPLPGVDLNNSAALLDLIAAT